MNHKTLTRKAKAAKERSDFLCLDLHSLATRDALTTSEKDRLPIARKASLKAIQFSNRLQRRLAKSTGAKYIPQLTRAGFKKKATFNRIKKSEGEAAAMNYMLGKIA